MIAKQNHYLSYPALQIPGNYNDLSYLARSTWVMMMDRDHSRRKSEKHYTSSSDKNKGSKCLVCQKPSPPWLFFFERLGI